jgi:hypothetical protein
LLHIGGALEVTQTTEYIEIASATAIARCPREKPGTTRTAPRQIELIDVAPSNKPSNNSTNMSAKVPGGRAMARLQESAAVQPSKLHDPSSMDPPDAYDI